MSETSTPVTPPERPRDPSDDVAPMPRWVPVAIGIVLVTLATLAVVTGLRYRDQTLVRIVQPRQRQPRPTAPAPPGEPEPGASLMFPGDASNVPPAHADITGASGSIVKMWARRGLRMNVTPPDAVVYINDVAVGQANQFDTEEKEYDFAEPGNYIVRLVAPGYKERRYVITAADSAKAEVARIETKLERQ